MSDTRPAPERDAARNRAQNHFVKAEQRDIAVKQQMDAERVAMDAKTAKLRALRLAKEEEDRIAAANAPAPAPKPTVRKPRKIKV